MSIDFHFEKQQRIPLPFASICGLEFNASEIIYSYRSIEAALVIGRVEPHAFSAPDSVVFLQRSIMQHGFHIVLNLMVFILIRIEIMFIPFLFSHEFQLSSMNKYI
jgi:hypothetical protein